MKKFLITLLTVVALALMLVVPALAEETPSTEVTYDQGDNWNDVLAEVTVSSAQYIKLMADTGDVTIDRDLYLDLNGHSMGTVTVTGGQLKVFDSTISDYNLENGYGTIGNIVLDGGSVIRDFVLPTGFMNARYRYVTFQHEGNDNEMVYSSHRIYLTMKNKLLMPTRAAVDCQVVLQCDEITAANIAEYGVKMYLHLNGQESDVKYGYVRDGEGLPVAPNAGTNDKVIRVFDILRDDLQLDEQELRAEDTVMNARAYLKFKEQDGAIAFTPRLTDESDEVVGSLMQDSFRDITEQAQEIADDPENDPLDAAVQSALNNMYSSYKALMHQWDVPIYCLCGASKTNGTHTAGCNYEDAADALVWQRYQDGCLNKSGNYYLVENLTEQTQITVTSGTTLTVNLNLNGKNITAQTGDRVFSVRKNATLTLTNTDAGENKGVISSVGHADGAGVVHVTYAGDTDGTAPVLNMFPGVTLANTEVVAQDGTARTNKGGVIKLDVGTLNMYGGTITGGKTTSNGGNVYIDKDATVTVYDGAVITNGTAPNGGNIYINGVLTVNGGNIIDGAGTSNPNTADIFNVGGEVNLNGGVVGYACAASSSPGTVNVSGSPTVTQLQANDTVNITGALTADADITIVPKDDVPAAKLAEGVNLSATELTTTAQAFTGTSEGTVGKVTDSNIGEINLATGKYYCLCGATKNDSATHKLGCTYETEGDLFWQPWPDAQTAGTVTINASANYYLEDNLDRTGQIVVNKDGAKLKVNLDLNGFNISNTANSRSLQVWYDATLGLTNTGTADTTHGVIKSEGQSAGNGVIQLTGSSTNGTPTVKMLDGVTMTNTDTAADADNASITSSGGVLGLYGNGNFYMYGGTMNGGYTSGNGGAVMVGGGATFHMLGGTINGGTSTSGGAIYSSGTIQMTGGTINGGTSTSGGAIYSSGTIQMTGGTINGSTATNGGAVYLNGGSMTMDGTGKAETAKPTITGGTTTAAGGAVYIASGGSLAVTHGTVKEGTTTGADAHGGNVSLKGTLTLNAGAKIIDGECTGTGQGGNVNVQSGGKLIVNDGEVTGGTCVTNAGVCADIFSVKGTITMTGGKLGKVSSASGANVSTINVSGAAKIELYSCSTATNVINITGALTAGADIRLKRDSGAAAATITETGLTPEQKAFAASCISGLGSTGYGNSTVGTLQADGTTINLGAIIHCLCGAAKTEEQLNSVTHKAGCTYETAGLLTWTRYDNSANLTNGKNYYLDANRTGSTATVTVPDGAVVNIDLNGYTLSRTGYSAITVNGGTLNLTNTSANPRHGVGGMITSAHSAIAMTGGSVTMLEGVTVKNTATTALTGSAGGAFNVEYGTVTMYGGSVIGGPVAGSGAAFRIKNSGVLDVKGGTITGNTVGGSGGAIYIEGTLNISNNAVINGGRASGNGGAVSIYGTLTMTGGTISGGYANNGGAVYIGATAKLIMSGEATITGGKISGSGTGGNLYAAAATTQETADKATIVLSGNASIVGGESKDSTGTAHGGNVYLGGKRYMKLSDTAHITGGVSKGNGGNVNLNGANVLELNGTAYITGGTANGSNTNGSADVCSTGGTVIMNGGQIGYLQAAGTSNSVISVGGTVVIGKYSIGGSIPDGALRIHSALNANSNILVNKGSGVVVAVAGEDAQGNPVTLTPEIARCFSGTDNTIGNIDGTSIKLQVGVWHCICGASETGGAHLNPGCDGELLFWQPWTETKLPYKAGNWYLTDSITASGQAAINTADAVINVDMNGHSITRTGGNLGLLDYGTLTLTNTRANPNPGTNQVSVVAGGSENNAAFMMRNTAVLNIYPGISIETTRTATSDQGCVIGANGTNTIYMYGGTIKGGLVSSTYTGGSVHLKAGNTLYMYGNALIEGGTAQNGGAVRVDGTLYMYGGTIDGSESSGVTNGGAVYVGATGTIEITDGTINGGTAASNGGAIYNAGTLTISGGTINGGVATSGNGGTIQNASGATLNISGGTINNGSNQGSANNGASCVFNLGGTVNVSGGTIAKLAGASSNPGTINVSGNPVINWMNPNSVINVTGALSGAQIHVNKGESTVVAQAGVDENQQPLVTLTNEMAGCFFGTNDTVGFVNDEGKVELMLGYCMCGASKTGEACDPNSGCDGTIYAWVPYTAGCTANTGNYYLTDDIQDAGQMVFGVRNDTAEKTVRLDLNGHSITRSSGRATQVWDCTTVWLCNTGTADETHGLISSGGVGISNGVIDSSNLDNHSAALQMTKATVTVNMLEGVTLQNNAAAGLVMNRAGAMNVVGTFNMFGGTIIGGNVANQGGALNIQSGSTFNMYAGTITGEGKTVGTYGGAIANAGTLNLYGGTIVGGTASTMGGAIYNSGTLNIANATITGGTAAEQGNTVYNNGTLQLSGAVQIDDITSRNKISVAGELSGTVGVTMLADYGRITDAGGAPYKNVFVLSGDKEIRTDADGLYVRYNDTDNSMYVAHAQADLAPTSEQFVMAQKDYDANDDSVFCKGEDSDGSTYNALPISGYGRYQPATAMDENNKLQADILVITDDQGDTVVLITADVGSVENAKSKTIRTEIANIYGIPLENIVLSANHIHSAPKWVDITEFEDQDGTKYTLTESYFTTVKGRIVAAVGTALEQRQKVTQVIRYTQADANAANLAANGKIFHEVRNYEAFDANGDKIGMFTNNHQSYAGNAASFMPETDVDSSLQIAGYVLQDGKQILIANFQTHPIVNGLASMSAQTVHADMIGYFRNAVEDKYDNCEVMYFSGASGNVDPKANKGSNENKNYSSAQDYGEALAALVPADLTGSAITVTDVKAISTTLTAGIQVDTAFTGTDGTKDVAERYAIAQQILQEVKDGLYNAGGFMTDTDNTTDRSEYHDDYALKYGIYSTYHASHIITRYNNLQAEKTSKTMTLGAYKIGDLAFISVPYEMYCENGLQVKNDSKASMTMVASLANGSYGYIPSMEGYENGGYSTDSSWFEKGTGEAVVEKFTEMLDELYPAN